jgi:nicotinate-nucleotide pyrophosphorylase (carboxylating)
MKITQEIEAIVRRALDEDIGDGDVTTNCTVLADDWLTGRFVAKANGVLAGLDVAALAFTLLDERVKITRLAADGETVTPKQTLATIEGPTRALLTGERTALNLLQRMSGIATAANRFVQAMAGTKAIILDTRKTVPGLRLAQKYAVRVAGGTNHRLGLYDGILIKENHIIAAGGITAAVTAARDAAGGVLIQVEVESLAEAEEALRAGPDRLLLDELCLPDMAAAVALRDRLAPAIGLEASGSITLENIRAVAATGVDFISVGSLTKHLRAIDLSMRFRFDG